MSIYRIVALDLQIYHAQKKDNTLSLIDKSIILEERHLYPFSDEP